MSVPAIMDLLTKKGIQLRLDNGHLKWKAPPGVMTPEVMVLLKRHKKELMERLRPTEPKTPPCEPFPMGSCRLVGGDCRAVLRQLPADSVDCMVTDPPYGMKFMNKAWDKVIPSVEIWKECLRVLKPGAFAYIMCSPRQDLLNRMIHTLESAGFDTGFTSFYWTYAAGYPKSIDMGKAVDKKLCAEREITGRNPNSRENCDHSNTIYKSGTVGKTDYISKPKTEEAKKLDGSYASFQPKPAVEVILVVMKPLDQKSYIAQALSNGKGISWMDDCRIPTVGDDKNLMLGRFPANLLVSDDVLNDGKITKGGYFPKKRGESEYFGKRKGPGSRVAGITDRGGYSRYFSLTGWCEKVLPFLIVSKALKKEKTAGLEGFPERLLADRAPAMALKNNVPFKARPAVRKNIHPTVKPIELMAFLITMGSREKDIILDPFCGTGTTCIAALLLNRKSIGIEIDDYYCRIAEARVRHWNIFNCLN